MSEGETTSTESVEVTTTETAPAESEKDWRAEYEKTLAQSRKWEDRAKANKAAADELNKVRAASMTELEKAVADATTNARSEVQREYGGRLVSAEIRAAAAGRSIDVDALLDGLDPSRFLTEDGEPNTPAIQGWVDKIVPAAPEPGQQGWYQDLGQGARGGPVPALNSTQLEKDLRDALRMQ